MQSLARRSQITVMQTKEPFRTEAAQIAKAIWEKIQQRGLMVQETQTSLQPTTTNQEHR